MINKTVFKSAIIVVLVMISIKVEAGIKDWIKNTNIDGKNVKFEEEVQALISKGKYEQARIILDKRLKSYLRDPELHFLLGKCHLALGNLAKAQKAFAEAFRLDKGKEELIGKAYVNEAKDSYANGDFQKSKKILVLVKQFDPALFDDELEKLIRNIENIEDIAVIGDEGNLKLEEQALVLISKGKYEQARIILDKRLKNYPRDPELHFLLGRCYLELDNLGEAQQSFTKAYSLDKSKIALIDEAYTNRAKSLYLSSDSKKADQILVLAKQFNPALLKEGVKKWKENTNIDGKNSKLEKEALALISKGKYEQARIILDKRLEIYSSDSELHLLAGRCYLVQDEIEKAQKAFSEAFRLDNDNVELIGKAYIDGAESMYTKGDFQTGRQILVLANQFDPTLFGEGIDEWVRDTNIDGRNVKLEEEAKAFINDGKYELARTKLSERVESYSSDSELHFLLGRCYLAQDELEKAKESFDKTLSFDEHKIELIDKAFINKAKDSYANGDFKNAEQIFVLAKQFNSALFEEGIDEWVKNTNIDGKNLKLEDETQALINEGKYDQAIKKLSKRVESYPNDADLYFLLGKSYLAQDKLEKAQKSFYKAFSLDESKLELINEVYINEAKGSYTNGDFQKARQILVLAKQFDSTLFQEGIDEWVKNRNIDGRNVKLEEEAEAFIYEGKYELASIKLSKRLESYPGDSELHFLLGNCYLALDKLEKAHESFAKTFSLDEGMAELIGLAYLDAGKKAVDDNNITKAKQIFIFADRHDPSIKAEISSFLVNTIFENIKNNKSGDSNIVKDFERFLLKEDIDKISNDVLELAKTELASSQDLEGVIGLGQFTASINDSVMTAWGDLVFQFMSENAQTINADQILESGEQAIQWNPELKNKFADLFFGLGKDAFKAMDYNSKSTYLFLSRAVSLNSNLERKLEALILDEVTNILGNLKTLGKDNVLDFIKLCEYFDLSSTAKKGRQYQLLYGLTLYEKGNKENALSIFRSIARHFPDSLEGNTAKEILAQPGMGKINLDSLAVNLKTKSHSNNRMEDVFIKFVSIDVKEDAIQVHFNAKANDEVSLLFARKNWNDPSIGNIEMPYIIDDNGKKFYARSNFTGGHQTNFNDIIEAINLNANEDASTISVKFPMVSEGASKIKVYSPALSQWQDEWSSDWLRLKDTPFSANPISYGSDEKQ